MLHSRSRRLVGWETVDDFFEGEGRIFGGHSEVLIVRLFPILPLVRLYPWGQALIPYCVEILANFWHRLPFLSSEISERADAIDPLLCET